MAGFLLLACGAMAKGSLVYNLATEPKTLDPHLATSVPENQVICSLLEGLTSLNEEAKPIPAIADKWQVSSDGTSYTFHLRQANWSNGEPVTADDFVYGWRRCLAPSTAAEYAYQLFPVKGAENYNSGKTSDPSTVGVVAESPDVLTVHLKNPTPFFLAVLAHFAYFPLKQSWVESHPDWATNPANYLCDGAFTLQKWTPRVEIIVQKNPKYYNAGAVKLDQVRMTMITNESTALLEWRSGRIDMIETDVPLPDVPKLRAQGVLKSNPYLGVYYAALQNDKKPFNDPRVRKAFSMSINREQITRAILRGGQPGAFALIPPGILDEQGKDFRKVGGDLFKEDIPAAKKLLAEAGYPNGRGMPKIKFLYNDLQMHRTIAEALQQMWLANLGVKVDLQVQDFKVYLQNLHSENYQMARAGWIADYVDPLTFLDMFQSDAGNNDFNYRNPKFDALLARSRQTTNPAERLALLHSAEKMVVADDMVVIPIYFYVNLYLQNARVKGIVRNPAGSLYFDKAWIEENPKSK